MPWQPSDAPRHQKLARSPAERAEWARVANAILKQTGDEGKAIRIANGLIRKRVHADGMTADEIQEIDEMVQRLDAAKLDTKDRNDLGDSDFAFPRLRKLPLKDASHVRNAMARFNQTTGWTGEEKAAAKRKIIRKAKEYGIDVEDFGKVSAVGDGDNDADDGNGVTKAAAHYTIHGSAAEHCGVCKHFEAAQNRCEIVEGKIVAAGWCEHFLKGHPQTALNASTFVLHAMALDVPNVPNHPNRMPFRGTLTKVGVPSDIAPNGSGGKRVMLTHEAAQKALDSLMLMGVDLNTSLDGHDPTKKIGVITAAHIDGEDLNVEGFIYAADFPREALEIHLKQADLGFSFEAQNLMAEGTDPLVITQCTFTGAAILMKDKAAYQTTKLAAAAGKEHENEEITDMDAEALRKLVGDAIATAIAPVSDRLVKIEAGHQAVIDRMEANKVTIEKVEPHAAGLEAAASRMEAAGIGLHPEEGHVHHLRRMAGHMRAEAAMGRIPHAYAGHHFLGSASATALIPGQPVQVPKIEDTPEFKALQRQIADMKASQDKAAADLAAKLKEEADKRAAAETKIKDLQAQAEQLKNPPDRKTLPPHVMQFIGKSGIEPNDEGKFSMSRVDAALANVPGMDTSRRIAVKNGLMAAGMLDASAAS